MCVCIYIYNVYVGPVLQEGLEVGQPLRHQPDRRGRGTVDHGDHRQITRRTNKHEIGNDTTTNT